ncbi:MAG TPA: CvpA family protein [Bradyrhizobium sp.]|uniref:CvpA family protein n=1 Tax=Bradyrhizobium sp. TaxID=376 RepID=UPI002BA8304C|nr:CvpA family protein [Bradyrhizobium sp.]HLZ01681.1 CvpA family protein [Bradyrhizobium sp.]
MNTFDLAVMIGFVVAVFSGFSTGLLRSLLTIIAYIVAMPVAVWAMSYVPPLDEQYSSPLGHNTGFFLGAFLVTGMVLGKLMRMPVDEVIGDDPSIADRLGGAALGVLRVGLVATSLVVVFDRIIPVGREPAFLEGSQLRPLFSEIGKRGFQSLPPEAVAAIDRLR